MSEYPQYYEVQDLNGEPFAMVAVESETVVTVIQRRQIPNSFIITRVSALDEVWSVAPGEMLGVHASEFEETLLKKWRVFGLSQEVMNATVAAGVESNVSKSEPSVLTDEDDSKDETGTSGTGDASGKESDDVSGNDGRRFCTVRSCKCGTEEQGNNVPDESGTDENADDAGHSTGTAEDSGTGDASAPSEPADDSAGSPEPVQDTDKAS